MTKRFLNPVNFVSSFSKMQECVIVLMIQTTFIPYYGLHVYKIHNNGPGEGRPWKLDERVCDEYTMKHDGFSNHLQPVAASLEKHIINLLKTV